MTKQPDPVQGLIELNEKMIDQIIDLGKRIAVLETRFGIEIMEDRGDDSGLHEGGDKNNEEPEPKEES